MPPSHGERILREGLRLLEGQPETGQGRQSGAYAESLELSRHALLRFLLEAVQNVDRRMKQPKITVEESSGNIFADLGFPNPEREEIKARLTLQIYRLITQRGLTQAAAGEILGIKQPHVSALMRGQSGVYSVERLMEFLATLGQDVQITVRPTRKKQPGHVSVVVP
jgi:predicted XRE-type DNA-binding protein